MATTKIISLHRGKNRTLEKAYRDTVTYVTNPEKTEGGRLVTGYLCDPKIAERQFTMDYRLYRGRTGHNISSQNDVIGYHLRQSFRPGEVTAEEANKIGTELAMRFTKGEHPFLVCTHTDRAHIHNHIVIQAVATDHIHKLRDMHCSGKVIGKLSDRICLEHGLSVIDHPKSHGGKTYNKWDGYIERTTVRDVVRAAFDDALTQYPKSWEELFRLLHHAGYEIKNPNGNNPSFKGPGQTRYVRLDTLGENYTREHIEAVFAGTEQHIPQKKNAGKQRTPAPESAAGSMLIDIQKKLQEGKGGGYAHWAKNFNIKQMAKTVIFLREQGLLDFQDLKQKIAEASAECAEIQNRISEINARMQEINTLRGHIINYAKTRDCYSEYRDSGFSPQYLAEHTEELSVHQAAKAYFSGLHLDKLPKAAELSEEYSRIKAERQKLYGSYRERKQAHRALLTAKSNVEICLGTEKQEPER